MHTCNTSEMHYNQFVVISLIIMYFFSVYICGVNLKLQIEIISHSCGGPVGVSHLSYVSKCVFTGLCRREE